MPRKPTSTANSNSGNMLSAVARLSEAERRLTQTLDETARYLPNSKDPLLLPTPQSMEEVKTVLAVARTYADRTSAPSGWNPNVPIYGFVTPNPLPHQLRGGQLAALQLQQAHEERERKRKAVRAEQEEKKRRKQKESEEMERERRAAEEVEDQDGDVKMEDSAEAATTADPKRRELDVMHEREDMVRDEDKEPQTEEEAAQKERQRQTQKEREARQKAVAAAAASATSRRREVPATMNLSDSSSSEEEESDDESE